jgi:endonuclease YncB( thermonuclease family)
LLNDEIIKQGYAFVYTRSPFARMEEFSLLEREARKQGARVEAPEMLFVLVVFIHLTLGLN